MKKKILASLVAVALLIQLVPVSRDNPPTSKPLMAPPPVNEVLRRGCYDCHSNGTVWPWYAYVAPVSWLVAHDVHEGREHLNFSRWYDYPGEKKFKLAGEIWEEVSEGEMPLGIYLLMHRDAKLSGADMETLRAWFTSSGVSLGGENSVARVAQTVAGDGGTTLERARKLSQWLNENFEWTYTDYEQRTVAEIIERRGGNCAEQARVLAALLEEAKVDARWVAEINIHTKSERRRDDAAELIAENDNGFSVFGYMHNDHRWLEVYDDQNQLWIPCDPTLGVFGLGEWMEARMGFGDRPEVASDMIVPFVVIIRENRQFVMDRTEHYLITEFDRHYDGQLTHLAAWSAWVSGIQELSQAGRGAFAAELNLHEYTSQMLALEKAYRALQEEYAALSESSDRSRSATRL